MNSKIDIQKLLENSPLLEASFHETLRVTSVNSSARDIEAPVTVGNKGLQPGSRLLMPYRQLHFEESNFGPQPQEFNTDRFLKNEGLSRSANFRPFGGGSTLCSGRFIAKREVMAFVASVIHLYDLRLQNPNQPFPRMDETKPTLGIMDPLKGDDLVLVVSPRVQ
jgi:cytochrome P450